MKFRFPTFGKPRWLTWRRARLGLLLGLALVSVFALYLDFQVRDAFEGRRFALPARLYARALEIYPGLKLTPEALVHELTRLEYQASVEGDAPARYARQGDNIEIVTRAFTFWDGPQPSRNLHVRFEDGLVESIHDRASGEALKLFRLDPAAIGGIYPGRNEDRVLVRIDGVPASLLQAFVAIEDRKFYSHHGIDPRGIARAAYSTLTGRGLQGGSTLTQQLVKNFFLTPERTLRRKATEILMALLLELHYSKDDILETYLNEIYLGQDGNRAIHGVGLASQFFFGKPVQELNLQESALLAGMVKGPSLYDPRKHSQRARERRNVVIAEMARLEMITADQAELAQAAPLGVHERAVAGATAYPAFLDLVRRQLRRDYRDEDLRSEGLRIFTTFNPVVQTAAEEALASRLALLDRRRQDDRRLEGAVVVSDVQSGEVLAVVGGRNPRYQGFNRALDALRPVGSLLKPVVYLTALAEPKRYTLATLLDDSPLVWKERGAPEWKPQNYDMQNHGQVPLRLALAHSYNVSTVRLGIDLGVERVLTNAYRLGIERELPPFASSLLGAVELTPIEIAQMYQTIASGGFRTPLRAIREVLTRDGQLVTRYPIAVEQIMAPEPVYLLTHAMQDTVRFGTAAGLRDYLPPELGVAGKTGTTDELRDAWFAGFSGDRVAVVWVGYDDNAPAGLTGASGAMPVWGELMRRLQPEPLVLPSPENIERVWIESATGRRADDQCPGAVELPFTRGSAPVETAECVRPAEPARKSWWRRLFE